MNTPLSCLIGDATSAAGTMVSPPARDPLLVVGFLATLGTSTVYPLPPGDVLLVRERSQTSAGASVVAAAPAGAAIGELRRLSGLTWEQLARLFHVSRRSLHFWASGKPMTPGNEEHLQRVLAVIREIDRGSARANRALLLEAPKDGRLPFDELAAGNYDVVLSFLGSGGIRRAAPARSSKDRRAAHVPPPPEERVDALQDRIHRDMKAARGAKSAKVRGDD